MADIVLRAIPVEVTKAILQEQLKKKLDKGRHVSLSETIISIIKEWEICYNSQKQKR